MPEIVVNGHPVAFAEAGGGEPVVMLHSGGSTARQWKPLASALADRCLCVMPDFPGHGASPAWPTEAGATLGEHAAIVQAFADRIGRPFHLVGHSHGGAVALAYAASRGDTLLSMTLIEPTLMHLLRLGGATEAWREAEALGQRHIAAVAEGRSAEIAGEFMPYWIGREAWQAMPPDRREAIVATMPAVATFWRAVFAEATPLETYAGIGAPTLLLRGSRTRPTTHAIVEILRDLMPRARLEVIDGAGHLAPLTHAAQVNAAVAAHVQQSGAAS
jgi:pimeloyl-ACP methyl ester carboxylesterase